MRRLRSVRAFETLSVGRGHLAKEAGFADVVVGDDGAPEWRNEWGGVQEMRTALRIRTVDEAGDSDVTPF